MLKSKIIGVLIAVVLVTSGPFYLPLVQVMASQTLKNNEMDNGPVSNVISKTSLIDIEKPKTNLILSLTEGQSPVKITLQAAVEMTRMEASWLRSMM